MEEKKRRKQRFNFESFYQDLNHFKNEHGHLLVPFKIPLGIKVSHVRRGNIKLSPEQTQRLNDIGFVWDAKSFDFEKFYQDLIDFKNEHGHLLVPQKTPLGKK